MIKLNLQYFGGRGSSGGKGGSAGRGSADRASIEKKIDKAGFKKQGLGSWEMNIDGVGIAQVVDETGSIAALNAGFIRPNEKAYSYLAWKYNENGTVEQLGLGTPVAIVPTLNEAKLAAKEMMKNSITR